jgi:hypothetical protein
MLILCHKNVIPKYVIQPWAIGSTLSSWRTGGVVEPMSSRTRVDVVVAWEGTPTGVLSPFVVSLVVEAGHSSTPPLLSSPPPSSPPPPPLHLLDPSPPPVLRTSPTSPTLPLRTRSLFFLPPSPTWSIPSLETEIWRSRQRLCRRRRRFCRRILIPCCLFSCPANGNFL